MPFARPTAAELQAQALSDIAAQLPGTDPLLPRSNLNILGRLLGEGFNAEYGYLDYIAQQGTPFTATGEALEGWAALKGVIRKAPSAATGGATSGASTVGTDVPAGTQLVRGDGVTYETIADVAVGGGGTATVQLVCLTPGVDGSLQSGQALALVVAIPNVSPNWTASAGVSGADVETDASLRTRMLEVYANPPQGGAKADYVDWSLEVPGVTRAWCVPNGRGAGTVVVYTMFDVSEAIHGGFPQGTGGVAAGEARDTAATQDLLAVADHIFPLQPVTPIVYSWAPQQNTVTFTINGLSTASTGVKNQVRLAIDLVFLAFGDPLGGTVDMSDIEAAIAGIPGTEGFVVTAVACNHGSIAPTNGNVTSTAGYLPVRGTVTFP
ncbi:MAG: baseplate J/gp47 family protein [Pseudomonadota bacterium]